MALPKDPEWEAYRQAGELEAMKFLAPYMLADLEPMKAAIEEAEGQFHRWYGAPHAGRPFYVTVIAVIEKARRLRELKAA